MPRRADTFVLEPKAVKLMEKYTIFYPEHGVVKTAREAIFLADKIGYPVVMKVVSPDALHKSDAGGVKVGVKNQEDVQKAFVQIRENLEAYQQGARFHGVRMQQMADDGYDMFIGGKQDDAFGPVVFFGMGGIFVELYKDTANSVCPATHKEIDSRLKSLKAFSLLKGMRGKEPGDVAIFVDTVVRVSHMLHAFPQIEELDINPMRVFVKGAMALDARMRIRG